MKLIYHQLRTQFREIFKWQSHAWMIFVRKCEGNFAPFKSTPPYMGCCYAVVIIVNWWRSCGLDRVDVLWLKRLYIGLAVAEAMTVAAENAEIQINCKLKENELINALNISKPLWSQFGTEGPNQKPSEPTTGLKFAKGDTSAWRLLAGLRGH